MPGNKVFKSVVFNWICLFCQI